MLKNGFVYPENNALKMVGFFFVYYFSFDKILMLLRISFHTRTATMICAQQQTKQAIHQQPDETSKLSTNQLTKLASGQPEGSACQRMRREYGERRPLGAVPAKTAGWPASLGPIRMVVWMAGGWRRPGWNGRREYWIWLGS